MAFDGDRFVVERKQVIADTLARAVTGLGGLLVTLLVVTVMLPIIILFAIHGMWCDRRLRKRYRRAGRALDWQTARRRTLSGEGILLVEILPKGYGYTWWIDADSLNRCPSCPLPSIADGYCRETIEHLISDAVRTWCDESFSPLTDHVCLVEVSPRKWRQGDSEFPRLSVRVFWGEAAPFSR